MVGCYVLPLLRGPSQVPPLLSEFGQLKPSMSCNIASLVLSGIRPALADDEYLLLFQWLLHVGSQSALVFHWCQPTPNASEELAPARTI